MLNPFSHRKILKKGTPGKATIVAMGALDRGGTSFNLPMTLQVYVEGMTPYEVEDQWMVKAKDTGGLSGTIPVRVDPDDPTRVAIDWDGVREQEILGDEQRRQMLAAQGPVTDLDAVGDPFGAMAAQAGGEAQGVTPVLDIRNDPELRRKIEQVVGRKLEPGSTETVAAGDPEMQMKIMQVVQEHMAQQAGGAASSGFPAGGAEESADDPTERLRQLAEMRDSGLITADEFDRKKAEILKEL